MCNLNRYYAEYSRFDSFFGWVRATQHYGCKNGFQRISGCNLLLKVTALSL